MERLLLDGVGCDWLLLQWVLEAAAEAGIEFVAEEDEKYRRVNRPASADLRSAICRRPRRIEEAAMVELKLSPI